VAAGAQPLGKSGPLPESLLMVDIARGAVANRFESGYDESRRARL
jgi:hypothetical protein